MSVSWIPNHLKQVPGHVEFPCKIYLGGNYASTGHKDEVNRNRRTI